MSTTTLPSTKEIGKGDRMELRRIVKGRFEVVGQQFELREKEVKHEIRKELKKDRERAIKTAERKSAPIRRRLEAALREAIALNIEMSQEGVMPKDSLTDIEQYHARNVLESLYGWRVDSSVLKERTDEAMTLLRSERGIAELDLRTQELQILERLSVDALDTDQAHAFLSEIPTLDTMMPMLKGTEVKKLVARV